MLAPFRSQDFGHNAREHFASVEREVVGQRALDFVELMRDGERDAVGQLELLIHEARGGAAGAEQCDALPEEISFARVPHRLGAEALERLSERLADRLLLHPIHHRLVGVVLDANTRMELTANESRQCTLLEKTITYSYIFYNVFYTFCHAASRTY